MAADKKPKKMEKTDQKLDRPYALLCSAVVARACMDYRQALKARKRNGPLRGSRTIAECEYFFRNDLDLWCDYDGEWIISKIKESVKNDDREAAKIQKESKGTASDKKVN